MAALSRNSSINAAAFKDVSIKASINTFSKTYYRLSPIWERKTIGIESTANPFLNFTSELNLKIAHILNTCLNDINKNSLNLIKQFEIKWHEHKNSRNYSIKFESNELFWFYNFRKNDHLPKSENDLARIYNFVEFVIDEFVEENNKSILKKYITISSCFVLWFLTKPKYFFTKNEYTKIKGKIIKKWSPYLISKEPIKVIKKEKKEINKFKEEEYTITNKIPEMEKKMNNMKETLGKYIEKNIMDMEEWYIHREVSNYLDSDIGSNKQKKINKYYQNYQKELAKFQKLKSSITKKGEFTDQMELENGIHITFKQIREKKTTELSAEDKLEDKDEKNILNRIDEEVPENWEDLF